MSTSSRTTGLTLASLAHVLVLGLGACGHNGLPSEHGVSPAARAHGVESAVEDVVDARCDLEERCNNVAPGQKFESRDVCESKMQGTSASAINTKDCPLGVDDKKLEICLATIRGEECTSLFDSLERWNACRSGQVCFH
jgi:hypothetical protein